MKSLFISLAIGVVAGIVDIIPMLIQKLDKRAIFSAFFQYLFVSVIIVNSKLFGIAWWLQGGMISLALSVPVIIMVSGNDKKSIPIIAGMSVVLGTLIGIAGHYFL